MSKLNQQLVDWQVAPAEHEISNYDQPKIQYRKYVEDWIGSMTPKSARKKTFYTISTNVLCADIQSSKNTIDPIDRDIYLPLEIALTKWSLSQAKEPEDVRVLDTKVWMFNPGEATPGSRCFALEHKKNHKIEFDPHDYTQNNYIETDLEKALKEINSFISAERTVFSLTLRRVRQDLGCLKWLNRETDYKIKPIKVYNLTDLYVVLTRFFHPKVGTSIGQGLANHRMEYTSDAYDPELQCVYHSARAKTEDGECRYCAKALAIGWTNVLINDVVNYWVDSTGEEETVEKEKKLEGGDRVEKKSKV